MSASFFYPYFSANKGCEIIIFQGPFQPSFKKTGCICVFKLLTLDNSLSRYPDPRQEGVSATAARVLATAFLPLPSSGCNSPLARARQPDREPNKCPKESKFPNKLLKESKVPL